MSTRMLASTAGLIAAPFVGSFLGSVIERLPTKRAMVWARSRCGHCRAVLTARELVPILSWLAQKGVCRHCGSPLSLFYPLIELAACAVAASAVVAMADAPSWLLLSSLGLGWTLLALSWIDARHYLLPDRLTVPLIPAGLAVAFYATPAFLLDHVIGLAAGGLGLAAIAYLYRTIRAKEGLGGGDMKLMAAAGAWVSWQGLPTVLLVAGFGGLLYAVMRAAFGRSLRRDEPFPFGPFLAVGFWFAWLLGPLDLG